MRIDPVSPASSLWKCRIALGRGPWTSLEPAGAGHPSWTDALLATEQRLDAMLAAREEAQAQEVIYFLKSRRLERRQSKTESGEEIEAWAALAIDGTWIESSTPEEAVTLAKRRRLI
jgi:hypothetical protein